ncbi:MAG: valine--tRNA ligase [Rhodospirillales bacterium]|nr:valine--tRNA ligase [Rhodospirillales bacterium]
MLSTTYSPAEIERRWYAAWEQANAFACGAKPGGSSYTIVIPPPNVTGSLHMGHALNNTLQDVLIRFARMRGKDALWQPGMDHAGIATQMVVERQLEKEGLSRHSLGRERFIERIWTWKEESGGTIGQQLRRLGASCDWSRERFTMDEGLSVAVRKVFVELYKQGLMYRDKRLVNWDPLLQTAIADLEVEQREVHGHQWYFRYPVEGEPGRFVTVATTRPETMLGDTAVAVHPDDERYADLVGRRCLLPIVDRPIPVVADAHADPEKGTGAVKITPAHDFNDFEVGRRHGLEMINVLDAGACMNEVVPERFRGLDRYEARDAIVREMESLGLLERIEDHLIMMPYGDRSGVAVEPWLTDQWFVDAKTLAGPAIAAVEEGRTRFVPEQWAKTYFEWMRNIQPWCVSRQIWWGHQIPAWYGPDGTVFVEESEDAAAAAARAHYGEDVALDRDTDVLDTWFSSALWPFSTLGWPERTPELERYPTDVLVTGFDIIFFWIARMMMMGLHFMDEVPFHTVYIHALVRDEKGQKMSKSKGNVIDPLRLIDDFGADALRMTLTAFAAQGRDVKMSEQRVAGYRNFGTKLWNAARFCEMYECHYVAGFDPFDGDEIVNRWIAGKMAEASERVAAGIEAYRFNEATGALYQFVWGTFCDWYLEFAKPILLGSDAMRQAETRATAAWVLDRILHVLHPFMPFLSEELFQKSADRGGELLIRRPWPRFDPARIDADAAAEMDWVVRLISLVRSVRAEMNVPPAAAIPMLLQGAGEAARDRLLRHRQLILSLARLSSADILSGDLPRGSVQAVLDEATVMLPIADVIDVAAEKARLQREMAKLDGEIDRFDRKLANDKFLAKAPQDVVETERERRDEAMQVRARLNDAAERLATFT